MVPAPAPAPVPALFPPGDGANHTWPAPNFVNPETRDWTASICIIVLFVITAAIFAARIWARFYVTRTQALDDWLIIASMPALLGLMISTVLGLRVYGFQLHIYDQTPATNITVRQITLAIETIYLGTVGLTKISILTFYRRITSSVISRRFMIVVWTSILFVAVYTISFIFIIIFTCWPVEAYWYRFSTWWLKTHTYKCHDELTTLVVVISMSTAQDFIACILPMFIIRKLSLPPRQKWALAGVFGMGLLTCATGALRVHYAHRVYYYVHSGHPTYDITWEALGSWVSTAVEANLAVICASAPALKVYCRCFDTARHEVRSFGWYQDRSAGQASDSTCWSNGSARRFCCCFGREDRQTQNREAKVENASDRNDSGMASGSQATSAQTGRLQYRDLDLDHGNVVEYPEEVELQDREQWRGEDGSMPKPKSSQTDEIRLI